MNYLRGLLISLFFLLPTAVFISVAEAQAATQTVKLSWTIPTTRADGTPITAAEIASYEIYYLVDGGNGGTVAVTPGSAAAKDVAFSLAPRVTPYILNFSMVAIDTAGLKSGLSQVQTVRLTVQNALPSPPTNIKVSVTCANGSCSLIVQ